MEERTDYIMNFFNQEFDIEMEKIDIFIESSNALVSIEMESATPYECSFLLEEFNKTNIKNVFKRIVDAIQKFIRNLYRAVSDRIIQLKLETKLKKLKEELAKNRQLSISIDALMFRKRHPEYKTIKEYISDYEKYVDSLVKIVRDVFEKKLDNPSDYPKEMQAQIEKLNQKFSKFINTDEQLILSQTVLSNLEMSEWEIKNLKRNLASMESHGEKALENIDKISKNFLNMSMYLYSESEEEDSGKKEEVVVGKKLHILQRIASEIGKIMKKAISIVARHPIEIGLLFSKKFAIMYDDKEYRKLKKGIEKTIEDDRRQKKEEIERIKKKVLEND